MKPHKKYFVLAGLLLFLFVSSGIAFASSSTFLTQAQKFINQNCSKKKFTDQTALLCYLFYKSQEQDTSINSLNATLSPIPGEINTLQTTQASQASQINSLQDVQGKSMKVLDANNNVLGIMLSSDFGNNASIFIPSINKVVSIEKSSIGRGGDLFFENTNCVGSPYQTLGVAPSNSPSSYNVISPQAGTYYTEDTSTSPASITFESDRFMLNGVLQCRNREFTPAQIGLSVPLIPITLPFSEPIATPLQFK